MRGEELGAAVCWHSSEQCPPHSPGAFQEVAAGLIAIGDHVEYFLDHHLLLILVLGRAVIRIAGLIGGSLPHTLT